jgi:outer membrane lipoprotein-sorting protein
MLRPVSAVLAAALFVVCAGSAAPSGPLHAQNALTADELIARNFKAKGGLEKWKSIDSIKQTVHLVSQGAPAEMTMYSKRPNLQRQELSVQGQLAVSAFDGKTAWIIHPQLGPDPVVLSGLQAQMTKDQSDFDGPLVDYKDKGSTLELVGEEMTDGVQTYHLKLTRKNASDPGAPERVEHVFLDATTFLETKVVSDSNMGGSAMTIETEFANYKTVDGVTIPFSIKTRSNGVLAVEMTVNTVEFNVKLDDAFFRMPVKVTRFSPVASGENR